MRATVALFACCAAVSGAGCSALVDSTLAGRGSDAGPSRMDTGAPPDAAPMVDTGPASPCSGLPAGVHCMMTGIDEPFVCVDSVCQLSRCGDAVVDARMGSMHAIEQCDDGNAVSGDGCEADCTFSCHAASDCDDMMTCNGDETCGPMHFCVAGTSLLDGHACTVAGVSAVCHGGVCRAGTCGDGTLDAGEECDDSNTTDGDGCQHDCTFTCTTDTDCQDGNACNGSESCNTTPHTCVAATTALVCDDMNGCTTDSCDMTTGCVNASVLVDADGDGHFARTSSCGGDDCNDANAAAYPGAPEPCGSTSDLNCDGNVGTPPTWYADCDRDTYAPLGAATMTACAIPSAPPSTCSGGAWTSQAPTASVHDCLDTSSQAFPTQSMFFPTNTAGLTSPTYDYNCDMAQEHAVPVYSTSATGAGIRNYVECQRVAAGMFFYCTGTPYWHQSGVPACGATGTLSTCSLTLGCTRVSTAGVVATCH